MTDKPKPTVTHVTPPPLDPPPDWAKIDQLLRVADRARLWPRLSAMGSEAMLELEYVQESIVEAREEANEAAKAAKAKEKADAEAKAKAEAEAAEKAAKPVPAPTTFDRRVEGEAHGTTNPK